VCRPTPRNNAPPKDLVILRPIPGKYQRKLFPGGSENRQSDADYGGFGEEEGIPKASQSRAAAKEKLRLERAFRAEVWKGKSPPLEAFEPVAKLITPNPPPWLKEHLRRWLPLFAHAAEKLQPSRAEMRASLCKIEEAASLLTGALGNTAIVDFLDHGADQLLSAPGNLRVSLIDLANRAAKASTSPALVDSEGRTKAGKGRARPRAVISARAYCALLVAETWLYFRGYYPSPRNERADEAADIYWRLAGGERVSCGNNPLNAWRPHFQDAREDQSSETKDLRAEYQRHLRESARIYR
jgi:hypothetical protein